MLISIGGVVVKCAPRKEVVDYEYIFPISSIAPIKYPRSSMKATNLAWSIETKAFF